MEPVRPLRVRRRGMKSFLPTTLQRRRLRQHSALHQRAWLHSVIRQRTPKGHFTNFYRDLRRYPEEFISFCRLPIPAFDRLLDLLRPHLTFEDTVLRKAVSAEERLLITLRFLATGESFVTLRHQFRVTKLTLSNIVKCTCSIIWQKLKPIVMPSPTEQTWLQVAAGFQTVASFPNCLGAVDGKHVKVQQPPPSGSRFFNSKEYFSVLLMAVADANYRFVAIDVGAYGSTGNSRVLQTSHIGLQILRDCETIPAARPLPGSTHPVPFVMVSIEMLPLIPNLLVPYPHSGLNDQRRIFNNRLNRACRFVECTFSIMSNRWRVFLSPIRLEPTTVDAVVKACCVLHNFAQDYTQEQVYESRLSRFNTAINQGLCSRSNSSVQVQDTFADYFMSPEGAVPWQYSCVGGVQTKQQ